MASNNKRIAKNTVALYCRMFISMIVGLYTSRVILSTLGVEDYGIYSVVGGVVAMFGFLNATMSGATSRFITYELGMNNKDRLKMTFSSAVIIHIIIALVIFVLAETVGLWFLNAKLVIPAERMVAANWVYQFSVISTMIGIIQVPYNASIIANEKMAVYAYVEIINACLRLGVVYMLVIGSADKLILYGFFSACASFLIALVYRTYCIRKLDGCRFEFSLNKEIFRPMLSFAGWDLLGNMGTIARTQGINVLLNVFFGAIVNAAAGIAIQVHGAIGSFALNIVTAVRPQIVKNYATGDREYMINLMFTSAKYLYLLLLLISLPIFIEMHFVLSVWLKVVPEYTVVFCRFMLIANFITTINTITMAGVHATGDMRNTSIVNGALYISSVPLTYIAFKAGGPPYITYAIIIVLMLLIGINAFYFLRRYVPELSAGDFVSKVLLICAIVTLLSSIAPFLVKNTFIEGWGRLVLVCITSVVSTAAFTYFIAATKHEKILVHNLIKKYIPV